MENNLNIGKPDAFCTSRRNFLKISGIGAIGAGLILAGCNDDVTITTSRQLQTNIRAYATACSISVAAILAS